MTTYAFREDGDIVAMHPDIAKPRPAHTMTEAAEYARAAQRRVAAEKTEVPLVTEHQRPIVEYDGGVPAAAKRLGALAERHGWEVKLYLNATGCALQGTRGDLGFRAYWVRGKTNGATWHERKARYTHIEDPRDVKVNERDRVGIKGYRSPGMGTTRLQLVASPYGLPLNVTELEKRIAL
jgi:hypothetical protein